MCPEFLNLIIENNPAHRSGAKIMLCNFSMKGYLLSSHIYIWTCPFCLAMTWCPSAHSIYLSVSSNNHGITFETCGDVWHVAPESKIQLVNCKMSPKYLLELSSFSRRQESRMTSLPVTRLNIPVTHLLKLWMG